MYAPLGTKTTSATGFKTVAGVKLRLFRFDRLPNVKAGLYITDETGNGAADHQLVSYVGTEGIGYTFDYPSGNEDVFISEEVQVPLFRQEPEMSPLAAEQESQRRLSNLTRIVGGDLSPNQEETVPSYRGVLRYFLQSTPVVMALELLDTALYALRQDFTSLFDHVHRHDGPLTVTSTTYLQSAASYVARVQFSPTWVEVPFLSDVVPSADADDIKTLILYVEPTGIIRSHEDAKRIRVSPDTISSFPVLFARAGENEDGNGDYYGAGSQFVAIAGRSPAGDLRVYFRNTGDDTDSDWWDVYLLGYQR